MLLQSDALESLIKSFGLAGVGLTALGLVLKYRPWEKRNGNGTSAEWELKTRKIHEEFNEEIMADMRNLMETRLSGVVSSAIRQALEPLPREIADALRNVLREKGL